ncbi:hypothetical protein ACTXT7_001634 [Hymenolepis weldensis]
MLGSTDLVSTAEAFCVTSLMRGCKCLHVMIGSSAGLFVHPWTAYGKGALVDLLAFSVARSK